MSKRIELKCNNNEKLLIYLCAFLVHEWKTLVWNKHTLRYNSKSDEEHWLMRERQQCSVDIWVVQKQNSHRHKNNSRGAIAIHIHYDACMCSTISLIFHNIMRYFKFIVLSFLVTGVHSMLRSLPSGQQFRTDQCHMHTHTHTQTPKILRTQTHASCFFFCHCCHFSCFSTSVRGNFSNLYTQDTSAKMSALARIEWAVWTTNRKNSFNFSHTEY